MLFGRAHEEIAYLRSRGVQVEVVPGVTAALAASADLAISLTRRGAARSVAFVTPRVGKGERESRWVASVLAADTAAIYMGAGEADAIAAALIGDPPTLVFDEPTNGLDPEGIRWIREFMQDLATGGRTVFVSSHLMSEMALTATELVVIGQGRLIAAESVAAFTERAEASVRVRSPQLDVLAAALAEQGASLWRDGNVLEVVGVSIEHVGVVALELGVPLYELSPQRAALEDAFMRLTADVCDHVAGQAA